jgi:hypothetical protein
LFERRKRRREGGSRRDGPEGKEAGREARRDEDVLIQLSCV